MERRDRNAAAPGDFADAEHWRQGAAAFHRLTSTMVEVA
jgi:hypothetical protein